MRGAGSVKTAGRLAPRSAAEGGGPAWGSPGSPLGQSLLGQEQPGTGVVLDPEGQRWGGRSAVWPLVPPDSGDGLEGGRVALQSFRKLLPHCVLALSPFGGWTFSPSDLWPSGLER